MPVPAAVEKSELLIDFYKIAIIPKVMQEIDIASHPSM